MPGRLQKATQTSSETPTALFADTAREPLLRLSDSHFIAKTTHRIGKISVSVYLSVCAFRLLDEASWATQGCAPLFRSAITYLLST